MNRFLFQIGLQLIFISLGLFAWSLGYAPVATACGFTAFGIGIGGLIYKP